MINNLLSFKTYFENLATEHVQINEFMYGDSGRIVSDRLTALMKTSAGYPVLFLETPTIKFEYNNNSPKVVFDSAFVILSAIEQEWDAQDAEMNRLFNICVHILRRMCSDSKKNEFIFFPNAPLEPLDNIMIDNALGWRVEFSLFNYIDINSPDVCFVQSMWEEPA